MVFPSGFPSGEPTCSWEIERHKEEGVLGSKSREREKEEGVGEI